MEASALRITGTSPRGTRTPLLRLQSDEKLVVLVRRGNQAAFELLVSRYQGRLLPFCRHMLRSREDAEDVLQEVFTAAFNAILADDRPINVRPWLYRIARNRCLNQLRRTQPIGVDTMDVHYSDHGASTADRVHEREEFRLLVVDIRDLPESQRTALLLREMEALSYDQIAEAMETTVPSVKSLLVRARISLAEAAEARLLSCEEVRMHLGEVAEGLQRRASPPVRRHLKNCDRCSTFRGQLKDTNKALAALLPISPLIVLKKLAIGHLGHSAGGGATAAGSAAGSGAAVGSGATAGAALSGVGGSISTAAGLVATKAAAGFAAAALVTAGAVEVHTITAPASHHRPVAAALSHPSAPTVRPVGRETLKRGPLILTALIPRGAAHAAGHRATHPTTAAAAAAAAAKNKLSLRAGGRSGAHSSTTTAVAHPPTTLIVSRHLAHPVPALLPPARPQSPPPAPGRTQTQTDATVIPIAATAPAPTLPVPSSVTPAPQPTGTTPSPSGPGTPNQATGPGSPTPAAPAPGAGPQSSSSGSSDTGSATPGAGGSATPGAGGSSPAGSSSLPALPALPPSASVTGPGAGAAQPAPAGG